ncbi:Expansin-B10 [Dirofilaria immitis]
MQSWIYILIIVPIRGLVDKVEAEPMITASVRLESDPLDCSFGGLSALIGHNNFSILGMLQNCAIFYILGENVKPHININLPKTEGSLNRCQSQKPLFYRRNNEYQLLIAQKMSIFTGQCLWQNNSDVYLSCLFDRKHWKKHSIKPSASDDMEIIGHITDIDTDILHVFYNDENGVIHDSTYNISSEKFIKQATLQQKNLKKLSYDSDRQLMYMFTNEMVYQRVKSNFGIFAYEPTYSKVNNFSRGSYSSFSFSNYYYIIKKTLGDGRVAYYAGKEGNSEQIVNQSMNGFEPNLRQDLRQSYTMKRL